MTQPNILLVVADHFTAEAANGPQVRTPNLDRLAAEGLRFGRAYTPVSVCCPARAMLLTGAYPWHNGVYTQVHVPQALSRDLLPDAMTYPERLRAAGYRLGYLGKWHASHLRGPLEFGFHAYAAPATTAPPYMRVYDLPADELYGSYRERFETKRSSERFVTWPGSDPFLMWACDDGPPEATYTHFLAERACRTLGEFADAGSPWHLEVHFPEPHDPYTPLREFLERYPADEVALPSSYYGETFVNKPRLLEREASLWSGLSERDFLEGRRHFHAYCEQVDHYVGRILDALAETGQADDTLVVFTSDHGDMAGAHRLFIKGWMPYEETHRVPLIARWPGVIPAGGRTDALVQLHDLAHTFCAAAGAEAFPHADGLELTPLFRNPDLTLREHLLSVYYGAEFLYTQRILIGERTKYIFNGFDWDEFYDLERDPSELHNVVDDADYQAEVARSRTALWETMTTLGDPYAAPNRYGAARYLERP